jgi:hypothetical protein
MKPSDKKDYGKLTGVATVMLVGSGSFCVLLLLYVVYYYALTGQRNFTNRAGMLVYYVLPAVLSALLFASLRLRPFWRISLSLVVLSTGISIYAANLFLALSDAKLTAYKAATRTLWFQEDDLPVIEQVAKEHGVEFDTRSKFDIINDLHAKGIEAIPSVIPVGLLKPQTNGVFRSVITINGVEALPLGGISNRVTVMCNESGRYQIYESDEHGFHNPTGIWSSRRIDVVALGDSFTQGHCVSSDRNFVALIRNKYPNTLNLGMNGQGPLITLATFREYVQPLNPKLVLWCFWEGNDITDLDTERKTPLLMRYLENSFSQSLLQRQRDIDQALASHVKSGKAAMPAEPKNMGKTIRDASRFVEGLITLSHLRLRIGLAWENSSSRELDLIANMDVLHGVLKEAKASVEVWGGKLYFVYLPAHASYSDPSNAPGFRDRVFLIAENLGIPVIDVHRAFQAQTDPLALFPFRRMGHYNEEGHRVVADTVVQQVAQ